MSAGVAARGLLLLAAPLLLGQTSINLRSGGPGFYVTGATDSTPIVIQTGAPHFLQPDDLISLDAVIFDAGPGCGSGGMLMGEFKIKAVVDTTHFAVMSTAGVDVPARGRWCTGGTSDTPGGAQWGGKLTPHTLVSGMRGWFDGDNGTRTRQIALGTWNGLVSLTVTDNVASIVTPSGYFSTPAVKIGVWGSGNSSLNAGGAPYAVTVDDATHAHFSTVGVANGTYTGANHTCGPSGTADCLRVSQWAYTGNAAWDAVVSAASGFAPRRCKYDSAEGGGFTYNVACSASPYPGYDLPGTMAAEAIKLFVVPSDTAAHDSLLYWMTHLERTVGVNFAAIETMNLGGAMVWSDFASYWLRDLAMVWPVIKPYLTVPQKQRVLDQIFNDIGDPVPCTKPLAVQTGGSATYSGTTKHITGIGTHFTTDLAVGDAIYLTWGSTEYYVSAVNSDTDLTVITNDESTVSTPRLYWQTRKWKTGDCGGLWLRKHWGGAIGAHPALYGANGGFSTNGAFTSTAKPSEGGNNGYTMMSGQTVIGLAASDDDPRAARLLQQTVGWHWNYMLPLAIGYTTGYQRSGAFYSFGRTLTDEADWAIWMSNGLTDYPNLGTTGPWITAPPMLKIYGAYPYPTDSSAAVWPARWGSEDGNNSVDSGNNAGGWDVYARDAVWTLAPNSDEAKYFRSWYLSFGDGHIYAGYAARDFFSLGAAQFQSSHDYKALPTQYLFQATSQATCSTLGLSCPPEVRGDSMISRGAWTSQSDSHVQFQARTFHSDHDLPQAGSLDIYKTGFLLQNYNSPPGALQQSDIANLHDVAGIIELGGTNNLHGGVYIGDERLAVASMDRWAGSKPFGDLQSRYAYAMANVAGMYNVPVNRANRHVIHFKKPGTEEIVVMYDDVDVSGSPTTVRANLHYPQNGQSQIAYLPPEGQTTCPGAGTGCVNLDSTRLILEQEDGVGLRQSGLITRFFSPRAITVRWDGSTYPHNGGNDNRVSICGGVSCGAVVSSADYVVVHKLTSTLSDTTLTAVALNPDANWTGVQTADKVALFARGGVDRISVDLATTHQGTAQYLIAGLEGGHIYQVHRHDDATDIAFERVNNGENTLYFEAPAGTYSIFPSSLSKLFLARPSPVRRGRAIRYDFKNPAEPAAYVWTVAAGALPPGVQLSTDGVLSGVPSQAGAFIATVRAAETDAPGITAAASFTIEVLPPDVSLRMAGVTAAGGVVVYGLPRLGAQQTCTLTVSESADFAAAVEIVTDGGGAAQRAAVLGSTGSLTAGTTFYLKGACGAAETTTQFTTRPQRAPKPAELALLVAAPRNLPVVSARAEYGPSPALGSVRTVACPTECSLAVPGLSGTVVYIRRSFLDASGRVMARGGIAPFVIP